MVDFLKKMVLLLCLAFAGGVNALPLAPRKAARITQVSVVSDNSAWANRVREWLELKGRPFSDDLLAQNATRALERLLNEGFYFARFDSLRLDYRADSTTVRVTLHLNPGERPEVRRFRVLGLDSPPALQFQTRVGRRFDRDELQSDIELLLDHFLRSGYPYCAVEVESLELAGGEEPGLQVALRVETGPRVSIGEIAVRGNERTRPEVVVRELPLRIGQVYDERRVEKTAPALMRLGYFKWVNPPRIELLPDGLGRLVVEVAEGNHNRFDGVLGYNPATADADAFVTGLIDVRLGNLFGTGRQIDTHWQRRTSETQDFRFRYTEPWIAGLPIRGSFGLSQLIQDTSYVEREINLDSDFRVNERLSLSAGVGTRRVSPDSLASARLGIAASNSLDLRAGFTYDTVDDPFNARSGVRYQTSFRWSRKQVLDASAPRDAVFNQKRLSGDFEHYFPVFPWQVAAIALHGREVTSGEDFIAFADQYRLGGANTVRGYREEQFRGSRVAWSNVEYRFLLGGRSRFFVFFDLGYFFREELLPDLTRQTIERTKIGYGLGVRLETTLGVIGIDYGLGDDGSFSNGKIHLGLTNEF